MENLKKHKGAIIAAVIIIAALAALFWWGGNAPGMQGWSVGSNERQTQTDPNGNADKDNALLAENNKNTENNENNDSENQDNNGNQAEQPENSDTQADQQEEHNNQNDQQDNKQDNKQDNELDNKQQSEQPEKQPEPEPAGGGMEINPETGKDKYNTDPVPEGKPLPVEPQDAVVGSTAYTCTLSISCATILDNMDWLVKEKVDLVPEDGWILQPVTVTFYEGESVFNVLLRVCKQQGIHMEYSNTPMYNSAYIEGIHNLYEFDCGEGSGWMYKVNDWFPNYGCSRYQLSDGDVIEWVYTCNYGDDVGGGNALGG